MSTSTCLAIIGIILQLIGAAFLVMQSFQTSRKLAKYKNVTLDNFSSIIGELAGELRGQFLQQLIGFAFFLAGSALQLAGAVMT
jgi:hypothetical protein